MKRIKLRIVYENGFKTEHVDAFQIAPGLAVHRDQHDGWTVTHIPSGLKLMDGLRHRSDAVDAAKAFASLGNWDRPQSKLPKSLLNRGVEARQWIRDHQQIGKFFAAWAKGLKREKAFPGGAK